MSISLRRTGVDHPAVSSAPPQEPQKTRRAEGAQPTAPPRRAELVAACARQGRGATSWHNFLRPPRRAAARDRRRSLPENSAIMPPVNERQLG